MDDEGQQLRRKKIGFQLWSVNLVFAFVRVCQAQIFGYACLKRKYPLVIRVFLWAAPLGLV